MIRTIHCTLFVVIIFLISISFLKVGFGSVSKITSKIKNCNYLIKQVHVSTSIILIGLFNPCSVKASYELISPATKVTISSNSVLISDTSADNDLLQRLKKGYKEISYLLNNWDEKTTYCNFGEIQRDILKTENKDKLLIAAATPILTYDKSATMVTMCKKDPQMVRALLGLTSDNLTLYRVEVLLRKPSTIERVKEFETELYFDAVDKFSNAISEIDSLTYEARSDFASTENSLKKDSKTVSSKSDYLQQSKISVIAAKEALEDIIDYLSL